MLDKILKVEWRRIKHAEQQEVARAITLEYVKQKL